MTTLESLYLAGWKSFKETALELRRLNVVIGANGAGKSNLVSFFAFLDSLFKNRAEQYVARAGGANAIMHFGVATTHQIVARLALSAADCKGTFETCLQHKEPDSLIINAYAEDLAKPTPGEKITNLSVKGSIVGWIRHGPGQDVPDTLPLPTIRCFHFHDTSATAVPRLSHYVQDNQYLLPNAANLAPMLYLYQETAAKVYRRIVSTVRKIVPDFDDFVLAPERLNPRNILLNWRQRGREYLFGPHQLSDGSLRAIALTTLLLQAEKDLPTLMVIDEPELGLHPVALEFIAGLVRAVSLKCQVILATQSATFVDQFEADDIVVADTSRGVSRLRRLDRHELKDWLRRYSVSDLWEKNVIGGGPWS